MTSSIRTPVLRVDPDSPDEAILQKAAAMLHNGALVAFPTETVYGLGADALNPDAVARIFQAKGRPANNPLIVHIGDQSDVERVAAEWPAKAAQLSKRFWPSRWTSAASTQLCHRPLPAAVPTWRFDFQLTRSPGG